MTQVIPQERATRHSLLQRDDPRDPKFVDNLIDCARRSGRMELLREGELGATAIIFGVHAFTVEAARARLQRDAS